MSKLPPSGTRQPIATNLQIPTGTFARPERPSSNAYLALSIPPEPFLIDLFCNWIEDPTAILIREWGAGGEVIGSWSIAEYLRDVLEVGQRIVLELGEEEKGRLRGLDDGKEEEEDGFIAVVGGGCYAFAVLVLAVYVVGGVVVPLCRCTRLSGP